MLHNKVTSEELGDYSLISVPKKFLEQLSNDIAEIKKKVMQDIKINPIEEYLSEDEAKAILKRETTWFWNMRKAGKLTGKKVAGKRYYNKEEIQKLFNQEEK